MPLEMFVGFPIDVTNSDITQAKVLKDGAYRRLIDVIDDPQTDALAGLSPSADTLPYFTGVTTADVTALTAFARTLIAETTAADARATLGADNSSNVNFLPSWTGAVSRSVTARLQDVLSVKDFGAVGDGATDDRAAIQAAFDACMDGGAVYVPASLAAYMVSGTLNYPTNKAITVFGVGLASHIKPTAGFSTTADVIKVTPTVGTRGGGIMGLRIGDETTPRGRHGIHVDTSTNTSASWYLMTIRGTIIHPTATGKSIKHTGHASGDGFFLNRIINNAVDSIELVHCGDAVEIAHNAVNSAINPGIELTAVSGAANPLVSHNNIAVKGTSIGVHSYVGPSIVDNTCEQAVNSDAVNGAMIDITGTTASVWHPRVVGNKLQINAGITGITQCIRLGACTNATVSDNRVERRGATFHWLTTASCTDAVFDGLNQWVTNDVVGTDAVSDAGTRTRYDGVHPPPGITTPTLGQTTLRWADLYIADLGSINWPNSTTIDHIGTAGLLITAADGIYHSGAGLFPAANDGSQLGAGVVGWSDLYLASGAVINFNNGNYTLTHSTGALTASGALLSASASGGIGYATGAGGTVTQITSKATGVTLNKACGQVTMNNAALGAGAKVSFVVTNSSIAATDGPRVWVVSGGTANAYRADVTAVGAGSFSVTVENITAGSLSEAPVIGFDFGKAVIS